MKYVLLLGFCAVIFLICFLIDKLIQKLFPKHELEKSKTVVRPPRKSAVFGVLLLVFPLMALLFWMPEEGDTLLTICCVGAMLMGAFLLVTYFSVSIYYGEDGFLYKTLRGGKKEYRYKDIRGQRSVMTRGGINTILFVGKDEINLYSAMQNLNPFLKHAFFRWCEANGIDPDSIENNPRMFTWFPDPDGAQSGLAACAKPAEPSPVAVSSVLALSSEQSAPAQTPEGQEKPAEPEHEWTQEDIRRMYQNIQESDWVFIDCLVTPDRANGCVGAALYWDGKESTLVRFFDEDGYSYCAGPVAKTAQDADFAYLGDGAVTFRLQTDDAAEYDYTLTLEKTGEGVNWTAKDSLTVPNP